MLNIKKYANGRFFNTVTKKYIKPEALAQMIKEGEKIQVTLTKTGKDITDAVIEQFSKKDDRKKEKKKKEMSFMKTDKLMKWLGDVIDSKIEKVMDVVNLPTREQVNNLDKTIKELNKKIDALKLSGEKATSPKKKATPGKKTAAASKKGATTKTASKDRKPADQKTGNNKTEDTAS